MFILWKKVSFKKYSYSLKWKKNTSITAQCVFVPPTPFIFHSIIIKIQLKSHWRHCHAQWRWMQSLPYKVEMEWGLNLKMDGFTVTRSLVPKLSFQKVWKFAQNWLGLLLRNTLLDIKDCTNAILWSKTTLTTGSVGGVGVDPPLWVLGS